MSCLINDEVFLKEKFADQFNFVVFVDGSCLRIDGCFFSYVPNCNGAYVPSLFNGFKLRSFGYE